MTNAIPLSDLMTATDLLSAPERVELLNHLKNKVPVKVSVRRGPAMAAALERIAVGSTVDIPDPSAWQREQRAGRDLPDR